MFYIGGISLLVGVVAAFIAAALLYLIGFFTNIFYYGRLSFSLVSPAANDLGFVAIAVPAVGGFIVGLIAKFGSERIRGHGIPEALEAILINKSRIEPKVTVLKPLSTAVSIGSGGPFGAEGPIIMTGGSFGSLLGQILKVTSPERRALLVSGAAAGMAATFNTPVAAVLLAVELLLFEWRPRSLVPVGLASVSATVVRWFILGNNPLFPITLVPTIDWLTMLAAAAVGLIAGFSSTILTYAVYAAEDGFRKLPIHWMWWPAIGGLFVGVGGLLAPRALGVGYDSIDLLLLGNLAAGAAATLLVVKGVIWSMSLGSGTSGGVLAPLIMIGAALGSLEAGIFPPGNVSLFAAISMGAMLGGVMRSPFTGTIFTLELTRDVFFLPPLLIAALVSYSVTVFTMKRSILTEKVARRGVHVSREYQVDVLEQIPVQQAMRQDFQPVRYDTPIEEFLAKVSRDGIQSGYPIVDDNVMIDYLTMTEVKKLLKTPGSGLMVGELSSRPRVTAYPYEPTRVAADRLAETDEDSLPVVDPKDEGKVLGIFSREDAFRARVMWFKEENLAERHLSVSSWLSRLRDKGGKRPSDEEE